MTTRAEKFFADAAFAFGAANAEALPPPHLPEFALLGRSNVGKSSLLNALTGQRRLAHVSATPGRTQQVNFYLVNRRLYLVDVPGYGFAQAPKGKITAWQNLLRHYLRTRPTLKRVFVLIDARHGVTRTDDAMLDTLDRLARGYQIVLTKTDAVLQAKLPDTLAAVQVALAHHPAAHPELLPCSALRGDGIEVLRKTILDSP